MDGLLTIAELSPDDSIRSSATRATNVTMSTSVVQDTILKTVPCILKTQDSILSGILRYLLIVSYLSIFKILFKTILGKWKKPFQTIIFILYLQDTFEKLSCTTLTITR